MRFHNLLCGFLLMILMVSCAEVNEHKEKKKAKVQAAVKQEQLAAYCSVKGASCILDTLDLPYTIDYEAALNSKNQVIDDFSIRDILFSNRDSLYVIELEVGYGPTFYYTLTCSDTVISKLRSIFGTGKQINDNHWISFDHEPDVLLFVRTKSIQKMRLNLSCDTEFEEQDYRSYLQLEDSDSFSGKGMLLDIQVLNLPD